MEHTILPTQIFAGNKLIKGSNPAQTDPEHDQCLLVSGRQVCCSASDYRLKLYTPKQLMHQTKQHHTPPLYYLGSSPDSAQRYWAANVTALLESAAMQSFIKAENLVFIELRSLISKTGTISPEEVAIAGHAVALTTWHNNHGFCNICGSKTSSIESGTKRQCSNSHKLYPRTDPVVIALVESPDGSQALLGRSKPLVALNPKFLTCLSGFIDQGETIEEAVAREVYEESGIVVDTSHMNILGSQPWPIGRGGSCELMIGCICRASTMDIVVDKEEMDDCRWVGVAELKSVLLDQNSDAFVVPPAFAIAHHLMALWVSKGGKWCYDRDAVTSHALSNL